MSIFPAEAVAMLGEPPMRPALVEFVTALFQELPDEALTDVTNVLEAEWERRQV